MKVSYFLLNDFNDLQKHVQWLREELTADRNELRESEDAPDRLEDGTAHSETRDAFTEKSTIIQNYEAMLSNCKICPSPTNAKQVGIGTFVKLLDKDTKKSTWHYIGSSWMKANPEKRDGSTKELAIRIAIDAPVAKAINRLKKRQVAFVKLPKKTIEYKIEEISL